jgi:hypothetical protein
MLRWRKQKTQEEMKVGNKGKDRQNIIKKM